jgi:hypothetical protein
MGCTHTFTNYRTASSQLCAFECSSSYTNPYAWGYKHQPGSSSNFNSAYTQPYTWAQKHKPGCSSDLDSACTSTNAGRENTKNNNFRPIYSIPACLWRRTSESDYNNTGTMEWEQSRDVNKSCDGTETP